jgi:hypothetical protein
MPSTLYLIRDWLQSPLDQRQAFSEMRLPDS